jgi:hypothetical protein
MHRRSLRRLASVLLASAALGAIAPARLGAGGLAVQDQNVPGITPASLAQSLAGPGITISNVTYIGTLESAGQFQGPPTIIGFDQGVILSSGWGVDVIGPNSSDTTSQALGTGGDPDLELLSGFNTFDKTVLEFDFVPQGSTIAFDYVFASEEYNEFANTQFNDVFAFFVNGTNCALVPGTGQPVSINTINGGNPFGTNPQNGQLYRNNDPNDPGSTIDTGVDGLTVVLSCFASVTPGLPNHIKLAIADASDGQYDSYVFLKAQSFVSSELSVGDASASESAGVMNFSVVRTGSVAQYSTVSWATANGTAVAPGDYLAASGGLTFNPGVTARNIAVGIVGDALDENDETFTVSLTSPLGASLLDSQGTGTIFDDDAAPALSLGDCAVLEGDAGSTPCAMVARLSAPTSFPVTAAYATANGTATAGLDYTAASGSITLAPLSTSTPIPVSVLGDGVIEIDETFDMTLSGPSNATLGDAQGQGSILDDDAASLSTLELTHGARHVADLAGPIPAVGGGTPDLYRIHQQPLSSYEIVVDGVSGDVAPGLLLERLAADNVTVLEAGTPVAGGASLGLRWENAVTLPVSSQHIRVSGTCGASCGPEDVYRIRAWDTTLALARFNNSATQVTVAVLHNEGSASVSGHLNFWSPAGVQLLSHPFTLASRATLTQNTLALPGLQGQGGTVTVSHDGPYGTLVGKAVAVEPATGFTFDTPFQPRPR